MITMKNTPVLLRDIYQQIYGQKITIANLNELAADLSNIARRTRPWTGKFLHSLMKGYAGFTATTQLTDALNILAARLNNRDEIQAQIKEITVSAVNNLPTGTIILGQARRCSAPGCGVSFVPTHPRQKYHSRDCVKTVRRLKRAKSPRQ
ncbi:MAG: hypothetical protein GY797_35120, partial [Deltaproteobacteria bacterium]|nr:hypothetical protein [Deltaproteobacteria bacterium]